MKDNQHVRDFLFDLRKEVRDLIEEKAKHYDIRPEDVVMVMCTGVYVNDDTQMVVGVTSTANDGDELESLLQGFETVLDNMYDDEDPQEGTIEWWIKNFGDQGNIN